MSTKKKIVTTCIIIFAVLMIPVTLVIFAFAVPPQYDMSFYGGMKIKYERLKSVKGKKIVVIGGSSVAFGLRSDIMEKELGLPVVNFGLYANLGTKYMLDVAEDYIGDGDIVIIAPEQNRQALSLYFNAEAVWNSVDGCYKILTDISSDNASDMAGGFFKFVSGKFSYWTKGEKPCPSGVYNVKSFNKAGDIVYPREYNVMKGGYDAGMPISFDKSVMSGEFINYLNDYRATLVKRGAKVLYSFCPMNESAIADGSDQAQREYYDYLTRKLDFSVIGNPESHALESDWFYDSNFHLNDAGAVYYTTILAQELKAELGDYSPVTTPVPKKPSVPSDGGEVSGEISEDLAEAAKIFELGGVSVTTKDGKVTLSGEFTVKGLTEYGKTLADITVPDTLASLPVTTIADECFKGNTALKNITFGVNISSVGMDVFDGCTSLRGVYITSLDPDSYHPASDIFDGLPDAAFYVPESVYASDYVINYFWGAFDSTRLKSY